MAGPGIVIAVAAVLGAVWYLSLLLHPWKTCPRCGGDKRIRGFVRGTHGDCGRCGNTGRVRRIGARGSR